MNSYVHTTLAMIAVINPVVCGTMMLQILKGSSKQEKISVALKTMFIILAILLISAVGGHFILSIFGISMDAFKIVGGIILAFIGFQMLDVHDSGNSNNDNNKVTTSKLILFAASPGSIAMVITLASIHKEDGLPVTVIIGTFVAVAITLLVVLAMQFLANKKSTGGAGMISKFMGLLIVAMGLQFMLDGIKQFFLL